MCGINNPMAYALIVLEYSPFIYDETFPSPFMVGSLVGLTNDKRGIFKFNVLQCCDAASLLL